VIARVLERSPNGELLIQTGKGLIWLLDYTVEGNGSDMVRVGDRLGYDLEYEIYTLKKLLRENERLR
jgi:hypothetical protein